jgi:hypothetical protein
MLADRRTLSANIFGLVDRFGFDAARVAEAANMQFEDLHAIASMQRDATMEEVEALAGALGVEPAVLLAP